MAGDAAVFHARLRMLTVEHLAAMTANLGDIEHPKHTAQLRWVSCAARAQPAREVDIGRGRPAAGLTAQAGRADVQQSWASQWSMAARRALRLFLPAADSILTPW
jgi:hypothetical protein